jgi:plasmid maintenance system antidote protein VapI
MAHTLEDNITYNNFRRNMLDEMERRDWTVTQLAHEAGIAWSGLFKFLHRDQAGITLGTACKIAKALDTSVDVLTRPRRS